MEGNIQLKMILRGWMRNRIYFFTAVLSLVVGLTCSVLLIGFVLDEYKTAHAVPDSGRLFLLEQASNYHQEEYFETHASDRNLAFELKNVYPEVEDICIFHHEQGEILRNGEKEWTEFYSVLPGFENFFHPFLLSGNLDQTLRNPSEMAVTRSFALKHFGHEEVMGESIQLTYYKMPLKGGRAVKVERIYTITSVIDDRARNFLDYPFLIGLDDSDLGKKGASMDSYYNFVKLSPDTDIRGFQERVNQDTLGFGTKFYKAPRIRLVEMEEVYFTDEQGESGGLLITRSRSLLFIGLSIALVILVLACFNYINISMTRALQRLKNMGQQMVFGASGAEMRRTLLLEAVLQVGIAFLITLGLLYRVLPVFNGFMNARLTLGSLFEGGNGVVIAVLLLLVAVSSSWYIFSKMGRTNLSCMLKQGPSQRSGLITGMVIAQFFVALVLLITVLNIRGQMYYIGHVHDGADRIYVLETDDYQEAWNSLEKRIKEVPGIEQITCSAPVSTGSVGMNGKMVYFINADPVFYDFYSLKFVAGTPAGESQKGIYTDVVVNETLVKKFEIKEPLGHCFNFNGNFRIRGVVRDFPLDHFSKAVEPLIIRPGSTSTWICIKILPEVREQTLDRIQELWKQLQPGTAHLTCKSLVEIYEEMHPNEQRLLQIVWLFTWISVFLTCLGLFGLAWFSVEQRKKEIAIRKVNGAAEGQVIILLCSRFVKWISWAFVLAVPVAYMLVHQWMMQFVYRNGVHPATFIVALFVIVSAGMLTVIWQSWKAANANPIDVVKAE